MLKVLLLCFMCFIPSDNWLIYNDVLNKFSINYPPEWSKIISGSTIAFLSPKGNGNDLFQENVNMMLQDLSKQPMDLVQYTALTKKQIVEHLGESAIVSLHATKFAGQESEEFIYNMKYQGHNLKIKQYWFIKKNIAYLFTYSAEPLNYNKYEGLATKIMNSFKFN